MCGYGNIVFFADSNDGTIEFKAFMRKLFMDKYDYPANGYTSFWMAQILPVAFHRSGQIALSCFNTGVAAATMAANGTLMWCPKELPYDNRLWQCLADLDGDGKLWVVEVSVRSSDKMPFLLAYDPENGSPHKSFSMEMPGFTAGISSVAMPAACDLNGDGRDEIVLSSNSGVYCIGNTDGKVSFLWKYSASGCGPAVIADIDADGFVEVIVATQSGKILIIDK
jgi:hypothetical protein